MIAAYLDDKAIKSSIVRELCSNKLVSYKKPSEGMPPEFDMAVTHGVLRGMGDIIRQCMYQNKHWMYVDNGYLGKYKRVILNATAPTTFREGRRFDYELNLWPWRGGQGKHILICPPSYPYMDLFSANEFLNYVAHNINRYTGRDLILRAKPAKPERKRWAQPLYEQLKDAYAVVTWGSAVALDALKLGIPTISLGWCPAKLSSFSFEDLETNNLLVEPDRIGTFDNLTWSSFDRDELPTAFDVCVENYNYKVIESVK